MFFARLSGRSILKVTGPDAAEFLQGLITCDVGKLPSFGSMLTARGRWLHSFIITAADGGLALDCQASRRDSLKARLGRYVLRAAVTLDEDDSAVWGLWSSSGGADVPPFGAFTDPRKVANLARAYGDYFAAAACEEKPEADYEHYCLGLGLAIGEPELTEEKSLILENGFDEQHGVSWDKGCYLGQEVMAHIKNHSKIKRSLLVAQFGGEAPRLVECGGEKVGEVRRVLGDSALLLVEVAAMDKLLAGPVAYEGGEMRCRRPKF